MVLEPILCPGGSSDDVVRHGRSSAGKPRYKCRNQDCQRSTFIHNYTYRGYLPEVKQQITEMALNGSGIRDTARVLRISPTTVIEELKKDRHLKAINEARLAEIEPTQTIVQLCQWEDGEAELDEMGRFVQSKQHQRWLWHALDHNTGEVLAYGLSDHKDTAFLELKALLAPFGITQFYTDAWGAYVGVACRRHYVILNPCFIPLVKSILKPLSANI